MAIRLLLAIVWPWIPAKPALINESWEWWRWNELCVFVKKWCRAPEVVFSKKKVTQKSLERNTLAKGIMKKYRSTRQELYWWIENPKGSWLGQKLLSHHCPETTAHLWTWVTAYAPSLALDSLLFVLEQFTLSQSLVSCFISLQNKRCLFLTTRRTWNIETPVNVWLT